MFDYIQKWLRESNDFRDKQIEDLDDSFPNGEAYIKTAPSKPTFISELRSLPELTEISNISTNSSIEVVEDEFPTVGLENLTNTSEVVIKEIFPSKRGRLHKRTAPSYRIQGNAVGDIYYSSKVSAKYHSVVFGRKRPVFFTVLDVFGNVVMSFYRPPRCYCCCCFCFPSCYLQRMYAYVPSNVEIGSIQQNCDIFKKTKYHVIDENGRKVLQLKSRNWCNGYGLTSGTFEIYSANEKEKCGKIRKKKSRFEVKSQSSKFLLATFPQHLDVEVKALIIGACFLIGI